MMLPIDDHHPIRKLFAGMVENTFATEIGLCEPRLTDYLADLMIEFLHVDHLQVVHKAIGKDLEQVVAFVAMTEGRRADPNPKTERFAYRQIGDFALFWTGIFPEHLVRVRATGDLLRTYVAKGKQSYALVAELTGDREEPPASLFESLSEEFESCAHGLGLVRRNWENLSPPTTGETDIVF